MRKQCVPHPLLSYIGPGNEANYLQLHSYYHLHEYPPKLVSPLVYWHMIEWLMMCVVVSRPTWE